jgi:hypothetical protein
VLGRIDTLSEAPRRTLKVASVAGRVFRAPVISGAYPDLGSQSDIRAHLLTLKSLDLVNVDRESDESYLFKHAVTHEAPRMRSGRPCTATSAVSSRVRADRRTSTCSHTTSGTRTTRCATPPRRAGDAAQAIYANAAAIVITSGLAPLLPEAEGRGAARAKVLETGRWTTRGCGSGPLAELSAIRAGSLGRCGARGGGAQAGRSTKG